MWFHCENQTGLESGRFKEFSAIQVTRSSSTSYGDVPADGRLARSQRKNKKRGGTGQTRSSVILLVLLHSVE